MPDLNVGGGMSVFVDIDTGNAERNLNNLKAGLTIVDRFTKLWSDDLAAGAINVATYEAAIADLAETYRRLQVSIHAAEQAQAGSAASMVQAGGAANGLAAANRALGNSATQSGAGLRKFANFFLQLGYTVDDVQYGMRGVANNLPMLVTAFGPVGMIAGGVIAILATLVQHFDQIGEALGILRESRTIDWWETLKSEMEQATVSAEAYKKKFLEIQELAERRTKRERQVAGEARDAVAESGLHKVVEAMAEDQARQGNVRGRTTDDEWDRLRNRVESFLKLSVTGGGVVAPHWTDANVKREINILQRPMEELREYFAQWVNEATKSGDPKKIGELIRYLETLPPDLAAGVQGTLKALRESLPAAHEVAKAREKQKQRQEQEAEKERHKQERAFEKEAHEIADSMKDVFLRRGLAGGAPMSKDEVAAELRRAGVAEKDVPKMADEVLEMLVENAKDRIRKEMLAHNHDRAAAVSSLVAELDEKEERKQEARKHREEAALEREKAAKKREDKMFEEMGERVLPHAQQLARRKFEEAVLGGKSFDDAEKAATAAMRKHLEDAGAGGEDADDILKRIMPKGRKAAEDAIIKHLQSVRPEHVDVIGGAHELVMRAQRGFSNADNPMLKEQVKMRRMVERFLKDNPQFKVTLN